MTIRIIRPQADPPPIAPRPPTEAPSPATLAASGLAEGPGGWWLAPEGAIVHPGESTAIVADLHLGYEWSRGAGGDVVPAPSLAEAIADLGSLLDRVRFDRLIVAGDLVESARRCRRTEADFRGLADWLGARGVELIPVLGNHDSQRHPRPPLTVDVAGWTIGHGHRPIPGDRTIRGHDHPILKVGRTVARCLLVSETAIVLPAFTANAAGLNVAGPPAPVRWVGQGFHCWAGGPSRVLDFGPIDTLAERVAGVSP